MDFDLGTSRVYTETKGKNQVWTQSTSSHSINDNSASPFEAFSTTKLSIIKCPLWNWQFSAFGSSGSPILENLS